MKKIEKMMVGAMIVCLGMLAIADFFAKAAKADTGLEAATRKEIGSYIQTRVVTGSSITPVALFSDSTKRPDSMCLLNVGSIVWIGTTTAAQHGRVHANQVVGFPLVGSSSTFRLEGTMSGSIYMVCDSGVASCEMRCIDGLVR